MLKLLLFILIFLFIAPTLAKEHKVYMWRNEKGVLTFSDIPNKKAKEIKIQDPQTSTAPVSTTILSPSPSVINTEFKVHISEPHDHATVRNNSGTVSIKGGVKPRLQRGYKIRLLLDGKQHGEDKKNSVFTLNDVHRGEHKIKLELINKKGKIIAYSKTITIYMHQARVK